MAEDNDKESRTEAPTERRLKQAQEDGNSPKLRALTLIISFSSVIIYLLMYDDILIREFEKYQIRAVISITSKSFSNSTDVLSLLSDTLSLYLKILLAIFIILVVLNFSPLLFLNAASISMKRVMPNFTHVSFTSGFAKLFSLQSLNSFAANVAKLSAYCLIACVYFFLHRESLNHILLSDEASYIDELVTILKDLTLSLTCTALIFAILEYLLSLRQWWQNMHMTKQEVKQEFKDMEGNILLKMRRRSLSMQMSRRRMLESIPQATVVIVNPTHYAVALKYKKGELHAPLVVAKGKNLIALRIKERAKQYNIPIVEDKPLARALHSVVEVNQFIPAEFYRAVATIINFIDKQIVPKL